MLSSFLGYLHLLPSWFGYCCGSSWVSSWAFVFLGYLFRLLLRRLLCFLLCFLFRGCLLLLLAGSFHLFPIALLTTSPLLWGSLHFGGSFSFRLSFGFRLLIMIFLTFPLSCLGLCCLTFPGPQRFLEGLLIISPKAVLLGQ